MRAALPRRIAVIHLPALPGSPGSRDAVRGIARAVSRAVSEARVLSQAGFDGLIVENFGDIPFYKDTVPASTIASMARVCSAVVAETRLPVGVNVLRNDALGALAVAVASGASFIRVNVLSGVAATDQGMIEGRAAELLRERERLRAKVAILGDVHVKHARSLSSPDIELVVEETALRAGADGVIVTGSTTGRPVDLAELRRASRAARHCRVPLYLGSGVDAQNASGLLAHADGVIVSSALRVKGRAGAPLDRARMRALTRALDLSR